MLHLSKDPLAFAGERAFHFNVILGVVVYCWTIRLKPAYSVSSYSAISSSYAHRSCLVANLFLVLGPTNTGKTHLALERMTGYASGMIGFPLRLLARENYDRLVALLGVDKVGLLTGEERILFCARYLCCTVESMPVEPLVTSDRAGRRFDFVAVDEVQLAGDRERGHIFTDRIMHARGGLRLC